ncbi:TetR family transcriptional regulator [Streptomyces sp. CNQ-509]|uniref:TetR/AcrR family transcriptional regulator n=1 Tax=unclassified Streptomyces TaxID=2593676 RepID=UPI00062DD18D|nr:TetR/AcrR family transcriptional regulator [Streptomyces sp. CNQ-509]AKH83158.1 TetR family transcriptional regulator [Streptomyces sp. CNQ-509]
MTAPPKPPARGRVLDAATRLFYAEGVHAVGVDRIIAEAGVAKATFYHHFRTKDDLVAAYVTDQCRRQQEAAAALAGTAPRATVLAVYDFIGEAGAGPGYRGCPFINAAAEYPDPDHPVRRAVTDYRRWFRDLMRDLLAADGHPDAERTADLLLVLRDGLVVGNDLDDAAALRKLTRDAVERVLTPRAA